MGKMEYIPVFFGYRKSFASLTDEQFGHVIRAALAYAEDGALPEVDPLETLAFAVIRGDIDRSKAAYEERCENNRKSIQKRWEKAKSEEGPSIAERIQTNTNEYERMNVIPDHTNVYERYETKQNKTIQNKTIQNNESIGASDDATPTAPAKKTKNKKEFVPPTVEEVAAYCKDKGLNTIDPEYFVRFYSESDWIKANGKPVRSWKSTVLTWAQRDKERGVTAKQQNGGSFDTDEFYEAALKRSYGDIYDIAKKY